MLAYLSLLAMIPSTSAFSEALRGSWVGTLEYRDYSDNSREKLGTLLRISKLPAEGHLAFRYVFDDGPHKVVQDEDDVSIDFKSMSYLVTGSDSKTPDSYQILGNGHVDSMGFGTLIVMGKAIENGEVVDVRQRITLDSNHLKILRETHSKGKDFAFRHEFVFTRVQGVG